VPWPFEIVLRPSMIVARYYPDGRASPLSLCHIFCLCATWLRLAQAGSQSGTLHSTEFQLPTKFYQRKPTDTGDYAPTALGGIDLIPSAASKHDPHFFMDETNCETLSPLASALVPSAPVQSQADLGLIPSQSPPPIQPPPSPSTPTPNPVPALSSLPPIPLIPSAPLAPGTRPYPSAPAPPNASFINISSHLDTPGAPVMQSTDQGLRPIPPAATQVGDPNGHHEITEPNFSATRPCRGCSPIIEMTATGWLDSPAAEQRGTSSQPVRTRVPAGPSNILISQVPSGINFVIGGSVTVTPGQTVTVDNIPVVIQTTASRYEVVVGTTVVSLYPDDAKSSRGPRVTHAPSALPPSLTIGSETIIANSQNQYIVSGQTLSPGGTAITVSGTTISLAPSATAVIINGVASSLAQPLGNIWTMAVPALTLNDRTYTANRAGYITITPGTVLKPGGEAVTVNGTTLSLDHGGTAVVIQGRTSMLQPATTVVTLTRSAGAGGVGGGNAGHTSGGVWSLPTNKPEVPAKPVSAAGTLSPGLTGDDGWLGGMLILVWWGLGYLAVEL
jgi:hypothetical protein